MRHPLTASLIVCLLTGSGGGCALMSTLSDEVTVVSEKSPLKPLAPSIDAIEIEVLFVERPIADPLIGSRLWSQLDQVSTLDASTVAALDRNGFRFGVSPSDPPRSLQAALGLTGGSITRNNSQDFRVNRDFRVNGQRYTRRSGEGLSIETWTAYPSCEIAIETNDETERQSYDNVRCVFNVTVERMQDGWARLEFTPEIHHGEMKMRNIPDEYQWSMRSSQNVDPQFEQRFAVELNVGEMVVLAADGDEAASLGHHFFRGGDSDSRLQRLLIVRLSDMRRIDAMYE